MTTIKIIVFLSILHLALITALGQCIFMVEKPRTITNLKYRAGDRIDLKTKTGDRFSGFINQIRDTAIVVNYNLIMNENISIIFTRRVIFSMLSVAGTKGGLAYVGIDGINNLINNERPVCKTSTLKTGSIMFGIGLLLKLVSKRKIHISNENWRIKVLDFSIIKDPGIYSNPSN